MGAARGGDAAELPTARRPDARPLRAGSGDAVRQGQVPGVEGAPAAEWLL